jgi:hypothetical protein
MLTKTMVGDILSTSGITKLFLLLDFTFSL